MLNRSLLVIALALPLPSMSVAAEGDQYHGRQTPMLDADALINERFNDAIRETVEEWKGKRDDLKFATRVRWNVDGAILIGRISAWSRKLPPEYRIYPDGQSIYERIPRFRSVARITHLATTLQLNGIRVGNDKLAHMAATGWTYYKVFKKKGSEERALAVGPKREMGVMGWTTTGVFSNGDLVANYEGYLFYRSLAEDGVVAGKPSIIRWDGDRPEIQRDFDIADHVNPYWDEVINTNIYRGRIRRFVEAGLAERCEDYLRSPEHYSIDPALDAELFSKYEKVGLRDHRMGRLDQICR